MGERLRTGDYGEFSFIIRRRRKYPVSGEPYEEVGHIMYATVIEADKLELLIRDNDEQEFLISRKNIRHFIPAEKPQEMILESVDK